MQLSEKGQTEVGTGTLACMRRAYPTDLADTEWEYIEALLPVPENEGRPRPHSLREILDAIFYLLKSGCPWRLLPHAFPPWQTVYHYFRAWGLGEGARRAARTGAGSPQ
jgi:putative transposase